MLPRLIGKTAIASNSRGGTSLSPDVKPVKGRSLIMHVVRSLGGLTRCKSFDFETCIKHAARQSAFRACKRRASFALQIPLKNILVSAPDLSSALPETKTENSREKS